MFCMETIFTGDLRLKLKRASSTVFLCDRSSHRQMYLKIKQNSQKKPVLDSFLIDCRRLASNLIKKETLVLLYSCDLQNTFQERLFL